VAEFKFSLESLKKYREQRLLLAKKDMAHINSKYNDILLQIERCHSESRDSLADALLVGTNVSELLLGAALHESSVQRRCALDEELKQISKDLEKHREWVTHLSRELKAVERLEEKQRERHNKKAQTIEKRKIDSWVAERWSRSPVRGGGR
jgi:flagellar export protein FliJ